MAAGYSPTWFRLFSSRRPLERTAAEGEWLSRHLPAGSRPRVLDLCCGEGRHVAELSRRGFAVVGVDSNEAAVRRARAHCPPEAEIRLGDMRELDDPTDSHDAAICAWQSFGAFSDSENLGVLKSLRRVVRAGGRLILDVYNADFFREHQGTRSFEVGGVSVVEQKSVENGRLRVELAYEGTPERDVFDWRIFTPSELQEVLLEAGWSVLVTSGDFDDRIAPSAARPLMQLVSGDAAS